MVYCFKHQGLKVFDRNQYNKQIFVNCFHQMRESAEENRQIYRIGEGGDTGRSLPLPVHLRTDEVT